LINGLGWVFWCDKGCRNKQKEKARVKRQRTLCTAISQPSDRVIPSFPSFLTVQITPAKCLQAYHQDHTTLFKQGISWVLNCTHQHFHQRGTLF
jgi:hypothetical protein